MWDLNLVISVPADGLASDGGARPSAVTGLTAEKLCKIIDSQMNFEGDMCNTCHLQNCFGYQWFHVICLDLIMPFNP